MRLRSTPFVCMIASLIPRRFASPRRVVRRGCAVVFMLLCVPVFGWASPSPKLIRFELPADAAEVSLKRFSEQSGLEVLFASQIAIGVRTKPVHGERTPASALGELLANTGLVAERNEVDGVIIIKQSTTSTPMKTKLVSVIRKMLAGILLGLSSYHALPAQELNTAANSNKSHTENDEPIVLSAFTVSSTQGKGYVANDAVAGLKSQQKLIDIPQSIQIVPRDVIEDLGQFNSSIDVIKYVSSGVIPYAYGEVVFQRGFRSGGPLVDGQADVIVAADPVSYDSFEVLKGPAAVLYGQRADLAGLINKHTRKPLPVARRSVRVIIGEGGLYRGEVDLTGPVGKLGSVPVSYRVIVAKQKYDGFQAVDFDNRSVFAAGLKFDFSPDTNLLLQTDYFDNDMKGITNNFRNAAGDGVYRGAGYSAGYKSRWSNVHFDRWWSKATLTHRFNDSWEMVSSLTANPYNRKDREVRNAGLPNYTTDTIPQYYFGYDYHDDLYAFQTDILGRYTLGGVKNQSNIGISVDENRAGGRMWLPGNIGPNFNTSITNPTVMDIAMPSYTTANSGTPSNLKRRNRYGYYMHTVDLFADKLSLVAGVSSAYLRDTSVNATTGVTTRTEVKGKPRRIGAVFKPTEGLAIFANNSTAFRGQGAKDFAGNPFPPVQGEVTEGGIKTAFSEGRISTTFTYFNLEVANLPVPDMAHLGFSIPAGVQRNKGFEADIAVRPLPGWSLIGSLYSGNILGVDGKRMASSINRSSSLLTKYDFEDGPLKGLSLGGSMFHCGDRAGAPWNAYTVYGVFAGYSTKSWQVMLNLDNLTDEFYSPSGWGAQYMDVGLPRNAKVTFSYRF